MGPLKYTPCRGDTHIFIRWPAPRISRTRISFCILRPICHIYCKLGVAADARVDPYSAASSSLPAYSAVEWCFGAATVLAFRASRGWIIRCLRRLGGLLLVYLCWRRRLNSCGYVFAGARKQLPCRLRSVGRLGPQVYSHFCNCQGL